MSVSSLSNNKIHLVGLNGLRAIAAIAVVISHINMGLSKHFLLPNLPTTNLAGFGVTIFFSLSGFLITMILLLEKETYRSINFVNFIIRRSLRIWPLYFFYIIINLVIFLFNGIEYRDLISYYLFFIPNIPFIFNVDLPRLGHYWSLGVEEQFYIFWPLLIKFIKNISSAIALFISLFLIVKIISNIFIGTETILYKFLHVNRFDCMAIGSLGGYHYVHHKNILIKYATNRILQLLCWSVIVLILINNFHIFSIFDHEIVSVITVLLIIGLSEKKSTFDLDKKWIDFLGKISFGIYVYHPLVIYIVSLVIRPYSINNYLKYPMVYLSIITLTILVAHISYRYFETPFLKFKSNYSLVKSSGNKY